MNLFSFSTFTESLDKTYTEHRIKEFAERRFPPEVFHAVVDKIVEGSSQLFGMRTVGRSFEGRAIRLITVGSGQISVLLWSQMHGDESTATMAIADILNYFLDMQSDESSRRLFSALTIHFLPMLNPDGAVQFQRRTAQGIDMNRDALTLVTPEARILKVLQQELKPRFGFNLHDQELSTVGQGKEISAIGLLTPSFDPEKSDNDVITRSKQLASVFTSTMNQFVPRRITKYDDSFEPRAFGDNMQKWGTSTLLVESGHIVDDPEKDIVRKLNFVGILASLNAITANEYQQYDIAEYENLPFNGKRAYDVIIRKVLIEHANGNRTKTDLGISYQVDTHSELPPKLVDIGDLSTFVGLREFDGNGKILPQSILSIGKAFEWEQYLI
jgi:hypothetical protein